MVSVLRAQGPFTDEKQKLLEELAKVLHISNERHRAEIRRAVNDDKLGMIAKQYVFCAMINLKFQQKKNNLIHLCLNRCINFVIVIMQIEWSKYLHKLDY